MVVSKKRSSPNFSARIISLLPESFQICPNIFVFRGQCGPPPPSPTPMIRTEYNLIIQKLFSSLLQLRVQSIYCHLVFVNFFFLFAVWIRFYCCCSFDFCLLSVHCSIIVGKTTETFRCFVFILLTVWAELF